MGGKMQENLEEILKLSVQEATEALLMSQSSVYSWIERGKLKTEELPSGKVIVISRNEIENIKEYNLKSRRNRVSKQISQNPDNLQENHVIDVEFSGECEENLTNNDVYRQNPSGAGFSAQYSQGETANFGSLEIAKLISDLSLKAGKYELLADLQKENRDNAEFWKNEFFRLQTENNELKAENILLKKELERAKRSVFGFLRK